MLSNPGLLRVSSLLGWSCGCRSPGTIPDEQTVPSNRLPHCPPQLYSWQGDCWWLGTFFFVQEKHWFELIVLELTRIRICGAKQGSGLTENHWHGVIPAETSWTFKPSGTLWNKICNNLSQSWQQKGIPDLPQWFFHDLTRSSLSNKHYYAFKQGELFQAWMHCSFVPGTLCQWSHGEALRLQPRSKHWLWWDISTWLPAQWLLLEHCSPRPPSIKSDNGTTPTSPEPSTFGICASKRWRGVAKMLPNFAELLLPFPPGTAFSFLWFWA